MSLRDLRETAWRTLVWLWLHLRPELPDEYLGDSAEHADELASQREYAAAYRRRLEGLQRDPQAPPAPIQLTFFPIAKNLRWVATSLHAAAARGRRTWCW